MSIIVHEMIIFAYLFGSISGAILICRFSGLPDPRKTGSKNTGATNVLRIGGNFSAIAVLIFDILKGALPVWFASKLGIAPFWLGVIGISACLGHIWPIFFKFKGGKGVATAFGSISSFSFDLVYIMVTIWLFTVLLTGYSSLGAIISALIIPFYVLWFKPEFAFSIFILSFILLLRHYDNIQRLLSHKERKIWIRIKK